MSTLTTPSQPVIVNDVFGSVFGLYRNRTMLLLGIVAIAQLPLMVIQLVVIIAFGRGLPDDTSILARQVITQLFQQGTPTAIPIDQLTLFTVVSFAVFLLQIALFNQWVSGLITNTVVQQFLRKPLSIQNAYWLGWRSATALLVAGLVVTLIGLGISGAGLAFGSWAVNSLLDGNLNALKDANTAVLIGSVLVLIIALSVIALVAVLMRFLFFPQVIVVERVGVFTGLRRSWELTGSAFWRVLGSVALVSMLVLIGTGIPAAFINFVVQFLFPRPDEDLFARQIIGVFVANLISILALPLQLSAYTMLYFDLRRHQEGFAERYE